MSYGNEKWEKREARLRGSGTRNIKIEEFSIKSPEKTEVNYEKPKKAKILQKLDSALVSPEDLKRPRLRRASEIQNPEKTDSAPKSTLRQNRKLAFSSDEDDENDAGDTFAPGASIGAKTEEIGRDFESPAPFEADSAPDVSQEPEKTPILKSEPTEELVSEPKRRRGRPKKNQREEKVVTVTRRSKRVEENPALRQAHVLHPSVMLAVRPLRALNAAFNVQENGVKSEAVSLTRPGGKQKPMVIETERVVTPSSRGRRVQLNTLDVLQQLVEEHTPRPAQNETVSENVVLTEFKAHLKYNLSRLADQHACIGDISQDINRVQRRKNELRRTILELRRQHAEVGAELARERHVFQENRAEHARFMAMAEAMKSLKKSVDEKVEKVDEEAVNDASGTAKGTMESRMEENKEAHGHAQSVHMDLGDLRRLLHPETGLKAQLQSVNAALAETLRES
ncbi:hypothetical protein OY671_007315 [Metschnikowia pulcherrima]|nr:hypothetical protein OY671_007315 [Metschnikowia pulcherrima]